MARVKLGDVAREYKQTNKNTSDLPSVGLEHLTPGEINLKSWDEGVETTFTKSFRKGQMLFGRRRAYLKKAALAPFDGICSGDITVIEAIPGKILPELLPFVIQNDLLFDYAVGKSAGSLSPRVKWADLKNYEFELPNIAQQSRLTELLQAAYKSKQAYKLLLQKTDEVVKSQFIEMFGDIKNNILLKECCTVHARVGWQALKKEEYQNAGDYMLITGTDFTEGHIDYSSCVYISKERYDMDPKIQVQNGDILITKDGTIGKVAIVEELPMPATLNAGVFVVRPDGRFNIGYFSYLFRGPVFHDFVEQVKSGTTIKHLNQGKLLQFPIPLASEESQKQFSDLIQQADKSKFTIQHRLETLKKILNAGIFWVRSCMRMNLNQILDKIFDNCRKLTPALIALAGALGLMLFLPELMLKKMGLDKIPPVIKSVMGAAFIISVVLIVTIIFWEIFSKWHKKYQNRKIRKTLRENYIKLPSELKAILISMMKNPDKKIILDSVDGDTLYLQNSNFIYQPQQIVSVPYDNVLRMQYVPTHWLIELYHEEPELFQVRI